MGFPSSSTLVLLLLLLIFFFFTTFLIDFHRKINNSGFLDLASTDPELIQDNSNGDYERVLSKKFLQVFVVVRSKKMEQSRVSRAGGGRGSVPGSPIGNKNRPYDVPPPPGGSISQLHH